MWRKKKVLFLHNKPKIVPLVCLLMALEIHTNEANVDILVELLTIILWSNSSVKTDIFYFLLVPIKLKMWSFVFLPILKLASSLANSFIRWTSNLLCKTFSTFFRRPIFHKATRSRKWKMFIWLFINFF